jgi:ATP synthase F1 gamma subunit
MFLEDKDKSVLLYTIGKKARNMFKKFFKKYFAGFILNLKDVLYSIDISSFIFDRLSKIKYDRLYLTFNRYFSINMQKALSYIIGSPTDFLNLIMDRANQVEKTSLFFQSIKNKFVYNSFFQDLFKFSHSLVLADALQDNRYSFLAGRFNGMDNTVRSTGDLIETLTIRYNKARQEHITTELIEIISCKEAITVAEDSEDLPLLATIDTFDGYDDNFISYVISVSE